MKLVAEAGKGESLLYGNWFSGLMKLILKNSFPWFYMEEKRQSFKLKNTLP